VPYGASRVRASTVCRSFPARPTVLIRATKSASQGALSELPDLDARFAGVRSTVPIEIASHIRVSLARDNKVDVDQPRDLWAYHSHPAMKRRAGLGLGLDKQEASTGFVSLDRLRHARNPRSSVGGLHGGPVVATVPSLSRAGGERSHRGNKGQADSAILGSRQVVSLISFVRPRRLRTASILAAPLVRLNALFDDTGADLGSHRCALPRTSRAPYPKRRKNNRGAEQRAHSGS